MFSRSPLCALLLLCPGLVWAAYLPRLKVSEDRRSLVTTEGKPFFYLGDTAWELFHRLNREDAKHYLEDRARKGFTVIQAVALAEFHGLTEPNPYGHLPLENGDPAKPVDAYFQHLDWVIDQAAELGMRVALLPTWGDKVNKKWGQGPEIFTPENARFFGEWIGRRYRDKPIIWVMGGDRPVETEQHRLIFRAMAEGVRAGDGGAHLITYHPQGRKSSAQFVHDEPWLDFNQLQSGHGSKNFANYRMLAADYAKQPVKPCMDAEPCYEDHPVREKGSQEWFDEWDVRKACYWGLFSGAMGHTYGAHSIWQMWDGRAKPCADPRHTWKDGLQLLGSTQVGHARRLVLSRPWLTRVPDQTLLASPEKEGAEHLQATRDQAGTYAMIYSPRGTAFSVDLSKFKAANFRAWWWDPRTGFAQSAGEVKNTGTVEFKPPRTGDSLDWVLVLDDPAQGYPEPGTKELGR